jgi:hypothetical protein
VSRQQRRALELLAGSPEGETEAMMQAHGFTIPLMVKLATAGLIYVVSERVNGMEIARVKISDAGLAVLTTPKPRRPRSRLRFPMSR